MELSVRIVSIDWHLVQAERTRLPEIRVYGSTPAGQTVCAHIRGFFPYLLIDIDELDFDQHDLDRFRAMFNEAMSSGQRQVRQYIESLEVVERRPIYGYHQRRHRQLRINLFDPGALKQAALLLRSGALCNGHRFAVQHAHLPFPLQFFIEYRLFGMNWMHVSPGGFRFRAPMPDDSDSWVSVPVSSTPRESYCCLETDVVAAYIRNVKDPLPEGLTVPSLADVWRDLRLSTQAICPLSLDARHQYEDSEIEQAYRRRLEALIAKAADMPPSQRPSQSMALSFDADMARKVCSQPGDDFDDLVAELNENRYGTHDVIIAEEDESSDDDETMKVELPSESDNYVAGLHDMLNEPDEDTTADVPIPSSQTFQISQNSVATEPMSQMSFTASQGENLLSVLGTQRPRKVPAPTLAQEPYFSDPEHRVKELAYIRKDGRRINTDSLFLEKTSTETDLNSFGGSACLLRPFKDPPTLHDMMSAKTTGGTKLVSEAGHIDSNGRVVMGRIGNHDAVSQTQTEFVDDNDAAAPIHSENVAPSPSPSPSSSQSHSSPFSHHRQHLRVVSLETLHQNRDDLDPDPKRDAVQAVVIGVEIDGQRIGPIRVLANGQALKLPSRFHLGYDRAHITLIPFDDEIALLDGVVQDLIRTDPDILVAYEIQKQSLGYLSERAVALGITNFLDRISRLIPKPDPPNQSAVFHDAWGERKASGLHVPGRIVLNLWRILRSELKLSSYNLHVVCLNLLGVRVPNHSWQSLNRMVRSGLHGIRRAFDDRIGRVRLSFALLANQNLLQRTSELARLFGIDFFSVLTRGSQFRVESVMIRQGVTEDFSFYSASPEQVAHQPAMECIPLVMEPRSAMYSDPVIVLDFQSLYPSIVISRDICYSTCLGSIIAVEKALDTGSPTIALGAAGSTNSDLSFLSHRKTWVSPNGVIFVDRRPDDGRNGLLPRLLRDLLEMRVAIKKAMKSLDPSNPRWGEMNAKQFGIKLLANVTYGYTAAGFSGRMPCAEIADSIVQTGRETLEKAIEIVENDPDWDAEVVYADTDSLFVSVPGRTLQEAFVIGQQISERVTAVNPPPVKLMFEKVYQPCLLVSKKRYVGLKYEAPDQVPVIDAKGLEVIRRDGCPLLVNAMDKAIKLMFKKDLSRLRRYLERLWTRMMMGEISSMQYVFAKEVRLGTYRVLPPAAQIATERMKRDPRSYPLYAERVPFLIVYGNQNDRLMDLAVPPERLLRPNSGLHINVNYYITKQLLPALNRITSLVHINIWHWWRELPRTKVRKSDGSQAWTIDRYCLAQQCSTCGAVSSRCLCSKKGEMPGLSNAVESHRVQVDLQLLNRLCKECSGCDRQGLVMCEALDCPSYHERARLYNRQIALDTG